VALTEIGFDAEITEWSAPSDWAAAYRAHGIQVVPSYSPRETQSWKRPKLMKWRQLENELVPQKIFNEWYGDGGEHAAHMNMGIVTGQCSGNIFVLDIDEYKPGAAEWWRGILAVNNNGLEPETWQQTTGGGGRQLLFRAPANYETPTNKTDIGIDVRGQGGFAVLPPSRHSSGQGYSWRPGCAPWECDVMDAPQWLLDAIGGLVGTAAPLLDAKPSISQRAMNTINAPSISPASGLTRDDGREEYMRDLVWAAVVNWHRECPIQPTEQESREKMRAAYATYEVGVKSRLRGEATDSEKLDREGRGPTAFAQKWAYAMRQWGNEVALAAKEIRKPHPPIESTVVDITPRATGITATPFKWVDARAIPPREWIYGWHYIRKFLSTTVAPGGVGKSSLEIAEGLAIATGRPMFGVPIDEQTNVWYWNGEDPQDELNRRVMATALYYGLTAQDIEGRFFCDNGRQTPITIAERVRDGVVLNAPIFEQVIKTIKDNDIGVMIIDPFIACHRVTENDNNEIDRVAKAWAAIADITGCSIELVHHVRKGMGGETQVEDGRGASALLAAARAARALNRMTKEEGEKAGVDHRFVFRSDDGKANLAPPSENAKWFQMVPFDLKNETAKRPSDKVGVVSKWDWPDCMGGVTAGDIEIVRARVNADKTWRKDHQSKDWVGLLIMEILGIKDDTAGRAKAKGIQAAWMTSGVLKEAKLKDQKGNERPFILAGEMP
jgi:hypothetical protein